VSGSTPRDAIRLIDGNLVRTRRLELGLSQRNLARTAGFGLATLRDIEDHDGQDRNVSIVQLVRLAGALDLGAARLIDIPRDETPTVAPQVESDDTHEVAHVLLEVRAILNVDDVAQTLGWTYRRTSDALDALNVQLQCTGLHVHRFAGRAQLRPMDPSENLTARVAHVLTLRRGIDRRQAGLVYAAMQGSGKTGRASDPGDKRGRPTLLLLGLLKDEGGRRISLGDDLRYALDL
jgi:transcriptional regulator with XRE-family HTH domain